MADFLDEKRKEIDARLKELEPLVQEYERLKSASDALRGVRPGGGRSASGAGKRGRRTSGGGSGRSGGRRGRPRGSGPRANQALEVVRSKPGITVTELAETMSIKPNYLYRVLPTLQKEGKLRKRGKGWHAA